MELTKNDAQKIAEGYKLGKIRKLELIKGGLVNHNYLLRTKKSTYVIRCVLDNSPKKLKHLKLQFKIFDYFSKKDFPYQVPQPLKINNKEILKIRDKQVWVYERINGQNKKIPNLMQMKQMAKALAIYHKTIKNLKGKPIKDEAEKRINSGFRKMQKINAKKEVDKLALKYSDFFMEVYKNLGKISDGTNKLFLHGDFDSSNVLFNKNKLIAIIDFDDASFGPRIYDISVTIRDSCCTRGKPETRKFDLNKAKIFLKEYEKINKLSKNEKGRIIPLILHANVDFFVWAYCFMKKEPENKVRYMKEMISLTKDIVENNKNLKLK